MSSYNKKMEHFDSLNEVKGLSSSEAYEARLTILKQVIEDTELNRADTVELVQVIAEELN